MAKLEDLDARPPTQARHIRQALLAPTHGLHDIWWWETHGGNGTRHDVNSPPNNGIRAQCLV